MLVREIFWHKRPVRPVRNQSRMRSFFVDIDIDGIETNELVDVDQLLLTIAASPANALGPALLELIFVIGFERRHEHYVVCTDKIPAKVN